MGLRRFTNLVLFRPGLLSASLQMCLTNDTGSIGALVLKNRTTNSMSNLLTPYMSLGGASRASYEEMSKAYHTAHRA